MAAGRAPTAAVSDHDELAAALWAVVPGEYDLVKKPSRVIYEDLNGFGQIKCQGNDVHLPGGALGPDRRFHPSPH